MYTVEIPEEHKDFMFAFILEIVKVDISFAYPICMVCLIDVGGYVWHGMAWHHAINVATSAQTYSA